MRWNILLGLCRFRKKTACISILGTAQRLRRYDKERNSVRSISRVVRMLGHSLFIETNFFSLFDFRVVKKKIFNSVFLEISFFKFFSLFIYYNRLELRDFRVVKKNIHLFFSWNFFFQILFSLFIYYFFFLKLFFFSKNLFFEIVFSKFYFFRTVHGWIKPTACISFFLGTAQTTSKLRHLTRTIRWGQSAELSTRLLGQYLFIETNFFSLFDFRVYFLKNFAKIF